MEINLNTNKMPVMPTELPAATTAVPSGKDVRPAVTISTCGFSPIAGSEDVDAATEADVATRNDSIGKLFQAFRYDPPPMPNFL